MGWLRRSFQRITGKGKFGSSLEPFDAGKGYFATPASIKSDERDLANAIVSKDAVEIDRDKLLKVARWVSDAGERRVVIRR